MSVADLPSGRSHPVGGSTGTFSSEESFDNSHERRGNRGDYLDFSLPAIDTEDPIVFLGDKDYAHLFSTVTAEASGPTACSTSQLVTDVLQ